MMLAVGSLLCRSYNRTSPAYRDQQQQARRRSIGCNVQTPLEIAEHPSEKIATRFSEGDRVRGRL